MKANSVIVGPLVEPFVQSTKMNVLIVVVALAIGECSITPVASTMYISVRITTRYFFQAG